MSDEEFTDSQLPSAPQPEPAMQPTGDNAASPRRQRGKKMDAEVRRRETDAFWRRCLSEPIGRRAIYEFLQTARYKQTTFACGPNGFPQPEATWFQAGERSVAERLADSLMVLDLPGFSLMLAENDPRFAPRKDGA